MPLDAGCSGSAVRAWGQHREQEPLEAVIAVPANAGSTQRFLTLEAFRHAGFQMRGLLNEPSAAGIKYAHHARRVGAIARRELVVVYDLGSVKAGVHG